MNKARIFKVALAMTVGAAGGYAQDSGALFKVPAIDEQGQKIEDKWIVRPDSVTDLHQGFTEKATEQKSPADTVAGGILQEITTWTRDDTVLIQTHLFDPRRIKAQKEYQPVNVYFMDMKVIKASEGHPNAMDPDGNGGSGPEPTPTPDPTPGSETEREGPDTP